MSTLEYLFIILIIGGNTIVNEKSFEYIHQHENQLPLMDQDTLNAVLFDQTVLLPERYNFQVCFFEKSCWARCEEFYKKVLCDECKYIVIVHYCSEKKPWHFRYTGGFHYTLWGQNRKRSYWRSCRVTDPKVKYVKYFAKRYVFRPALKKQINDFWVVLPDTSWCFGF